MPHFSLDFTFSTEIFPFFSDCWQWWFNMYHSGLLIWSFIHHKSRLHHQSHSIWINKWYGRTTRMFAIFHRKFRNCFFLQLCCCYNKYVPTFLCNYNFYHLCSQNRLGYFVDLLIPFNTRGGSFGPPLG